MSAHGWHPASEMLGSRIVLSPPRFPDTQAVVKWQPFPAVQSEIVITPEMGRFLGYFMGDGSFGGASLSVCCDKRDADVVEDVAGLIRALFGQPTRRAVGTYKGGTDVRLYRKRLADVFHALGVTEKKGSNTKRVVKVPECIWESPITVIREFLRGLFESDGFAGYETAKVSLFAKNLDFLRDVQLLLLAFGITARLTSGRAINGSGFRYQANTLTLRASEAIAFVERVGFVSSRKGGRCVWKPSRLGRNALPLELKDNVVAVEPAGAADVGGIGSPRARRRPNEKRARV
jgi:LAGLIDADG-like domain